MRPFRLPRSWRRLRWKLTLSYTLVTVAVLLILVIAANVVLVALNPWSAALSRYRVSGHELASEARPLLEAEASDAARLTAWLRQAVSGGDPAVLVSPSGALLAANTQTAIGAARLGQPFVDPEAPDESRTLITQALQGKPGILGLDDGTILSAQPILGEGDEVLGALYVRGFSTALIPGYNLQTALAGLAGSLIGLTIAAGLIGTLFGRLTSRGLVRRLESLDSATEAWGQGDFSAIVHDTSPDEIGQLTRRLNRMAEQIQDLLQLRQDLATLEERNRLARDLHDSVKQQVFATTMTLGTAKTLRQRDPETAWRMVDEALDLSWEAQQELTGLIHELRPVELEGKGLAAALQEYASRWSHQTGIEISLAQHGEHTIPPEVEAALFRLAQEALANVSKHSEAKRVEITLVRTASAITLQVEDDGCGFDPASAAGQGMGLRSMQERIEALGGELTVDSAPGTGTRLVARLGLAQVRTGME